MMRTVEVFLVIVIILGAFIISSYYTVLPTPRRVSPLNLERWAWTTLQILDSNFNLSAVVFKDPDDPVWDNIQAALSALLPPNIVYNFTVYEVQNGTGGILYNKFKSISNVNGSLGIQSEAASYLVSRSYPHDEDYVQNPVIQVNVKSKLNRTLYILNCSDARGWWITGYTAQSLAYDLYKLLSRYFNYTIMVNNTAQLKQLLAGNPLSNETVTHAVVINTFGEAVPIIKEYAENGNYAGYCRYIGQQVRRYNWTWVSIVGWPFHYVTNTVTLANLNNSYGIFGMVSIGQNGLINFLQGVSGLSISDNPVNTNTITAYIAPEVIKSCHRYGIYPSLNHTATRSLDKDIMKKYNMSADLEILKCSIPNIAPGALFCHREPNKAINGSLLAIGITRTPDIRLAAVGILAYYKPDIVLSAMMGEGGEILKLIILQLGQVGGI